MEKLFLWIAILATYGVTDLTGRYADGIKAEQFLYPPPNLIERFAFGFQESMADSLWLRWIQDSDSCQTYLKPVEKLQPQTQDPLLAPRYKNCDNSWSFRMLDGVTKLDPKFKMPYLAGAISLSVLTEDYEGATEIFDRGLKQYPNDWNLAYRAAYHYLFDLGDKIRAAELMTTAAKNGAPDWLQLLAARLYSTSGQVEMGLSILENYKASLKDEKSRKAIDDRIADLKAKLNKR